MTRWEELANEATNLGVPNAYDIVRRKRIDAVRQVTGRHLVIYATDFTNPVKAQHASNLLSISPLDKDGFDEVTRNLRRGSELDVLLYSPGGSAEATESIVALLRDRFSKVRFIIPNMAKSAATMMAMSGDELFMDELSELGPTDPQIVITRDQQANMVPAQAILDQFKTAQQEVNDDPNKLPVWVPILREFGPALLAVCENQMALTRTLVSKWLATYMFADDPEGAQKADKISTYWAEHNNFLSHARRVGMVVLQQLGVKVNDMRDQPDLHAAVRDLHTTIMLTFMNTLAVKICENDLHEAIINSLQVQMQVPAVVPGKPGPRDTSPSSPTPRNRVEERLNRQHRRR